jgi:hypothetical protein
MEVDKEAEFSSNPKKRKAPETLPEDSEAGEAVKKRTPVETASASWRTPISEADPLTMTLDAIDLEIVSVKGAILSLKETIAKAELLSSA